MHTLEGIGLGILQGLTEFLPVSSSGHLVILESLFKVQRAESVIFEVSLHFATLLAIIVYYRERLARFITILWDLRASSSLQSSFIHQPEGRMIFLIFLACVPTALIGVFFKDRIESLFNKPQIAGIALLVTSLFLASTFLKKKNQRDILQMNLVMALLIGTAQGVALIPGISRSGITISVALLLGLDRRLSADFSFLLAIPAILGASLISIKDIAEIQFIGLGATVGGFLAAFITGYCALYVLINIVRHGKFYLFAPYCFIIGVLAILFFK